jgi:hypothetical protein
MFKSINNSRNLKIQIAVFIFVVNIDVESHRCVVCISCVCMVLCRGKELLLIFQIACTLVFYGVSFDGYTFNQATVQDRQLCKFYCCLPCKLL